MRGINIKFKCTEDGCDFESDYLKGIKSHYRLAHGGKKYTGGGAVPDDVSTPPLTNKDAENVGPFDDKNKPTPIDPYDALRQILDNYGYNSRREAIINNFSNYDMEDLDALDEIMKNIVVKKGIRELIIDAYAAALDIDRPREEKEEEAATKKKVAPFNPMDIGPEQIMTMTPGELMKWKQSLMVYRQAMETYNSAQSQIFGGPPGMMAGQYPPEIQAIISKFKAMEDREAQRAMLEPIQRQLDALTQGLQKPQGGGDDFDMLMKRLSVNKLIDSMGNDKEVEKLRVEANQSFERMRMEKESREREMQATVEGLRIQQQNLQMEAMRNMLGGKIQELEQRIASAGPQKGDIDVLQELSKKMQLLEQFRTGQAPLTPEEKKTEMVYSTLGNISKDLAPLGRELIQGINQANLAKIRAGLPGGAAVQGPPPAPQGMVMGGTKISPGPGQVAMNVSADGANPFECYKCHKTFTVQGQPPVVVCPFCGQEHSKKGESPAEPVEDLNIPLTEPAKEPTDAEIRESLMKQPREALDNLARSRKFDPSVFSDTKGLVDALMRMRK